jgi:hypothetical protein
VSDDEAFKAALGRDVAGFESDWLAEIGATPPTRLGPRPAPVGPLPSGWSGPQPDPSFEIVGSPPPPAPAAPLPGNRGDGQDAVSFLVAPLATLGLVVIVVIAIVGARRIRRRPDPAAWAERGDNRLFGRPADGDPQGDGPASPSRLWSATDWSLPREPDETTIDSTAATPGSALDEGAGLVDGAPAAPPPPAGDPPSAP